MKSSTKKNLFLKKGGFDMPLNQAVEGLKATKLGIENHIHELKIKKETLDIDIIEIEKKIDMLVKNKESLQEESKKCEDDISDLNKDLTKSSEIKLLKQFDSETPSPPQPSSDLSSSQSSNKGWSLFGGGRRNSKKSRKRKLR